MGSSVFRSGLCRCRRRRFVRAWPQRSRPTRRGRFRGPLGRAPRTWWNSRRHGTTRGGRRQARPLRPAGPPGSSRRATWPGTGPTSPRRPRPRPPRRRRGPGPAATPAPPHTWPRGPPAARTRRARPTDRRGARGTPLRFGHSSANRRVATPRPQRTRRRRALGTTPTCSGPRT
ncbi:hypothetical protein M885DRAFT_546035 [Pelagophyceae sp. CCMP2097]|nr:hypothetical protein M885DRAFT_546035 [Pelagophyceae sp. CCMP2097]